MTVWPAEPAFRWLLPVLCLQWGERATQGNPPPHPNSSQSPCGFWVGMYVGICMSACVHACMCVTYVFGLSLQIPFFFS